MPLAMSDLLGGLVAACTAILVIQLLKLSDLGTESRNLFPKDYEVIHTLRIALGEAECGANPAVPGIVKIRRILQEGRTRSLSPVAAGETT
jgi:hypothetical protein